MFGEQMEQTNEEKSKRRTGWNEITGVTAPMIDGRYKGDYDGTYAITRNKLEHIKGQSKMERIGFSLNGL